MYIHTYYTRPFLYQNNLNVKAVTLAVMWFLQHFLWLIKRERFSSTVCKFLIKCGLQAGSCLKYKEWQIPTKNHFGPCYTTKFWAGSQD